MSVFLKKAFTDTTSRQYFWLSDFLAVITILSIISLVLETVPSLSAYNQWFLIIEWVAVAIFTVEYILHTYYAKPRYTYIFSFFGLVDLVSVLPTFLGLGNLTFLKSARTLRLLRLLRMVRLAKLGRHKAHTMDLKMDVFALNIAVFVVTLMTALIIVGVLMHVVEGENSAFGSIPFSMLWAFKVFMVGLPTELPETAGGQAVHVFARFVGLIVFGVLVGMVGNIYRKVLVGNDA